MSGKMQATAQGPIELGKKYRVLLWARADRTQPGKTVYVRVAALGDTRRATAASSIRDLGIEQWTQYRSSSWRALR